MHNIECFFSPSKLNLFLNILKKRSDGFHELVTLYQAINFGDLLSIQNSSEDSLSCNVSKLLSSDNLIWRSLEIFRRETKILQPVKWSLKKQIPIRAGLGGGSSNAATALYALNQHFQTDLSLETLKIFAQEIGSDVPFFFSSGTALGSGRGESLLSYEGPLTNHKYVLYFSSQGVMTKDAYSHLLPEDFCKNKEIHFEESKNDLEKPVFRLRPDLLEKKLSLQKLWEPFQARILMSGSGATLFARYPREMESSAQTKEKLAALIKKTQGLPVNSLNRSQSQWYKEKKFS